tara:strand:- start:358 stop:480 length:123 start_codon:yes stop_codon:yes gene_type:complete
MMDVMKNSWTRKLQKKKSQIEQEKYSQPLIDENSRLIEEQ